MPSSPSPGVPSPARGPWTERAALAGLVAFTLAWDLWAVLVDRRPSGSDTTTYSAVTLYLGMEPGGFFAWLANLDVKGPVPALLAWPLLAISGDVPLGTRLLSVLCHGAQMVQAFDLGRVLAGGAGRAGLWAALLCATTPLIFGWDRMDFQEPVLAVVVMASLQLMLRLSLRRAWHALPLGLAMGLGLATKLSFAVMMVAPGLWLLARRVRSAGDAVRVALALLVMGAVTAPWAVPCAGAIYGNFFMSTHMEQRPWDRILFYLELPGVAPLLAVALTSTVWLWIEGRTDRWALALLGGTAGVSLLQFFLVFDYWSRYIVPVLVVAAVPAGAGLHRLSERAGPRARAPAAAAAAALLALFVTLNLRGYEDRYGRETGAGMIRPDPRPYDGFARAVRLLGARRAEVLVAYDSFNAVQRTEGWERIWMFRRLPFQDMEFKLAEEEHERGLDIPVILFRAHPEEPLGKGSSPDLWPPPPPGDNALLATREPVEWLMAHDDRRRLGTVRDPDGITYVVYLVPRAP